MLTDLRMCYCMEDCNCSLSLSLSLSLSPQLPAIQEPADISPSPPAPLTPHSTKKAFMETMLAPEPSTLDDIYDEERARELFVPSHNVVSIEVSD